MAARSAGRKARRRPIHRRSRHPPVRRWPSAGRRPGQLLQEEVMDSQTIEIPETIGAAPPEVSTNLTPDAPPASARPSRSTRAALAAFTPVVTAAIALAIHR